MVHDTLLLCMNFDSKELPNGFILDEAVTKFFHPCETNILHNIQNIVNLLRYSFNFAKLYGSNENFYRSSLLENEDGLLPKGLYLKAFANGIESILQDYLKEISNLENRYLETPSGSLVFIYHHLELYKPLALFILKLVRFIQIKKIHGCAIMKYLYQNTYHGDEHIYKSLRTIQRSVDVVFLKQLTHWILYGKLVDSYGEFFIQNTETRKYSMLEKGNSSNDIEKQILTISDGADTYDDIWRYEICYKLLPKHFSSNWVEKVLFIGQTVLIFKVDPNKFDKSKEVWNNTDRKDLTIRLNTLWDGKEQLYVSKIQDLHKYEYLNITHYERVVDEIKKFVTNRLSEIAVNEVDLVHQLKLIKDFYLLGRGELFLEFINVYKTTEKTHSYENNVKELLKSFEIAAHSIGVLEGLDQFSLNVSKPTFDTDGTTGFGLFTMVQLQYKIIWPLHLIFSPKVLDRYNSLFRFLLVIKNLQYGLHMVWCKQRREYDINVLKNMKIINLRNQLMFFIDNLQYYIQVDVLESQFSILHNIITNKGDFEQIQKAHSIFLANILSLCFLLTDEDANTFSICNSNAIIQTSNPIYRILEDIFCICNQFCSILNRKNIDSNDIQKLEGRNLIQKLMNLLGELQNSPSTTSLSQLLLRLDFNYWFSSSTN